MWPRTQPFRASDFYRLQYEKSIFHTVSDKNLTRGKAGYEATPLVGMTKQQQQKTNNKTPGVMQISNNSTSIT